MDPRESRIHVFPRSSQSPRSARAILASITGLAVILVALTFLPPPGRETGQEPVRVPEEAGDPGRATQPATVHTAVVTTDALHIRQAASDTSRILGSLPSGQRVTIIGQRVNGFVPVTFGAYQGWMAEAYLAPDDASPDGERWIEVNRARATVTLHEGSRIVATYQGVVGGDRSDDGYYATAPGTFHVYSMVKDLTWTPFAVDGYITDWVGFDPARSNGFHSPIRDASGAENPVQSPVTKGCVRLSAEDAARVFAFASLEMRVEVHD